MRRLAGLFLVAVSGLGLGAAAGCSGDEGEQAVAPVPQRQGLSVRQALRSRSAEPVFVEGYLVSPRDRPVLLCSSLGKGTTPRCGAPALRLEHFGVEGRRLSVSGDGSVAWSPEPVELVGLVRGRTLVVEEEHR